jgi:hypothetical protein
MQLSYVKSNRFLWPTTLLAVFMLVFLVGLTSGSVKYTSLERMLIQWDGQHYLSIARDGYEMFPCPRGPHQICGNVGWFPLFPLTGRAVAWLGLDVRWALLLAGWLALWAALLLLFDLVRRQFDTTTAAGTLVALLAFPSAFYFLTAFPYALFLLLAVLTMWLLQQEHFSWLWLPSGLLAVTYPSGVVIVLPLIWYLVSRWRTLSAHGKAGLLGGVASVGAALSAYAGYYWYRFDDLLLYARFQNQPMYAHEPAFPLLTIFESLRNYSTSYSVTLIISAVVVMLVAFYRTKVPATWQLFMFGILLFTPAAGTTDCYYRHIVVAFPLAVMVGLALNDRRRRWLVPAYIICAQVMAWVGYLPQYKEGRLI